MIESEKAAPHRRKWAAVILAAFLVIGTAVVFSMLLWSRHRLETVLEDRIDRWISGYSPVVSIAYDNVGVGIFGRSIHIRNIRITPIGASEPFRIGRLVLHRFDRQHRVPEFGVMSAESVEIPGVEAYLDRFAPMPGIPGDGKVTANLFLDYAYDPETRSLTIRRFSVRARDLGTLSMSAAIGNVSPENAAMVLVLPYALQFEGMSLVYSDDSLVALWMAELAAQEGVSPDAYARELKARLANRAVSADRNGREAVADALEAVMAFLDRPEMLCIDMRPEQPVLFGRLLWITRFEDIVDLLNVRVSANGCE